ncbi:MAG: hypothetical protein J7K00_00930 [Candidatus Diapherotrites archaeon]|nr:hypothetical protein [Candidatus Diapherotrites archaeon]
MLNELLLLIEVALISLIYLEKNFVRALFTLMVISVVSTVFLFLNFASTMSIAVHFISTVVLMPAMGYWLISSTEKESELVYTKKNLAVLLFVLVALMCAVLQYAGFSVEQTLSFLFVCLSLLLLVIEKNFVKIFLALIAIENAFIILVPKFFDLLASNTFIEIWLSVGLILPLFVLASLSIKMYKKTGSLKVADNV